MVPNFAVIGNPIAHSLSPKIHQLFSQQTHQPLIYEKILGDEKVFEQQVSNFFATKGKGLNITLPFKQRAFELASIRTPRCQIAGAANTLWLQEGVIHADNTDGIGLVRDLKRYITLAGTSVLILGAGGAARGIIEPLINAMVGHLTLANRSIEKARLLQQGFSQIEVAPIESLSANYDLIINATAASLTGKDLFFPRTVMNNQPFCYDLVYKQSDKTPFVHYAESIGCPAADGLGMLIEQAAEAFFIWHDVKPDTSVIRTILLSDA